MRSTHLGEVNLLILAHTVSCSSSSFCGAQCDYELIKCYLLLDCGDLYDLGSEIEAAPDAFSDDVLTKLA